MYDKTNESVPAINVLYPLRLSHRAGHRVVDKIPLGKRLPRYALIYSHAMPAG